MPRAKLWWCVAWLAAPAVAPAETAPLAPCASADLDVRVGKADAGMSKIAQGYSLRNTGSAACTLEGYPAVDLLDGRGRILGKIQVLQEPGGYFLREVPIEPVTLQPGEAASFGIEYASANVGTGRCREAAQLRVGAPGTVDGAVVGAGVVACGPVRVTPIRPGEDVFSLPPSGEPVGVAGAERAEVYEMGPAKCYVYEDYVVWTAEKAAEPGQTIRVRRREGQPERALCEDAGAATDTVIEGDAYWFFGLSGGSVFIDQGTGPARSLVVYDLAGRAIRYEGGYGEPIALEGDKLTFYELIGDSSAPCPEAAGWRADGLAVGFEERVQLDLQGGAVTRSGEIRCVARQ